MKVAILGYGTVGSGCGKALKKAGIEVKRVLDLRSIPEIDKLRTTEIRDILDDPEIGIAAELMGGEHPAYDFVKAALLAGKHVVTANKQMLSLHYAELTKLAEEKGLFLLYSATAGGGIPWIRNLKRTAKTDDILRLGGVMNGTTNYILDKMQTEDMDFTQALQQAQALGYAEADPTADVMGYDVRAKLAISCNVAWGGAMDPLSIPTEGITGITREDIKEAKKQGLVYRLLGSAEMTPEGIRAEIKPELVGPEHPAYQLSGAENLFYFEAAQSGRISFRGMGAGSGPTGANVAEDIEEILEKYA